MPTNFEDVYSSDPSARSTIASNSLTISKPAFNREEQIKKNIAMTEGLMIAEKHIASAHISQMGTYPNS